MTQRYDYITLLLVLALVSIGLVAIYSATSTGEGADNSGYFVRQLIWASVGLTVMVTVSYVPLRVLQRVSFMFYGFTLFLLIMVLLFGRIGQGAERWLDLGPIHLQPSELAKLATVMAVAAYQSDKYVNINKIRYFVITLALILAPFALIVRQPDLGTALVFLAVIIPLLFWAGLNWFAIFTMLTPVVTLLFSFFFWAFLIWMLLVILVLFLSGKNKLILVTVFLLNIMVGTITPSLWNQLRPYQQKRILTFVNPEKDPRGAGYQIIQSKVAIGSGGFWGKGYLQGSQTHLRFLPAQHTDFIFSVIGEEFGFVGILIILLLFYLLIYRLIALAAGIRFQYASLVVIGIATIIAFHVIINIGMTIGLAPVTGLPLPFISYGGSFLMSNLLMIGVVLNVARNKYTI
jgi:rod shape determining protein RodA